MATPGLLLVDKPAGMTSHDVVSRVRKLAGTKKLQQQIESGVSEKDIRESWKKDLEAFKIMRH